MKAVAIADDRSVSVIDVEPQRVGPDEVRVQIKYAGICGSDLHFLEGDPLRAGLVLGHEFSGAITELGDEAARSWSVGDRVTVLPVDPCGKCKACLTDEGICYDGLMQGPGLGRQGGYAESVVVPTVMLRRLPDEVSDIAGAVAEPLAVALRGIENSGAQPSDAVCVLGAGPIGFMTVVALNARGFANFIVVDPNDARRQQVARLGVKTCTAEEAPERVPAELGQAPKVVIDCSGHRTGAPLALALLAQRGRLTVVGGNAELSQKDSSALNLKELTINGSLAYSDANFAEAIEHLAAGRVPVDEVVSKVADLSDAWAMMQELASGKSNLVKVLLKP